MDGKSPPIYPVVGVNCIKKATMVNTVHLRSIFDLSGLEPQVLWVINIVWTRKINPSKTFKTGPNQHGN